MASHRVVLKFPADRVEQPVTWKLVKDFDLAFNILRARVTDKEGVLVLGLEGNEASLEAGLAWVAEQGVSVEPLGTDIVRNEDACTHCGACINICPTDALTLNLETRRVVFETESCVACELCVAACPYHAMSTSF